MFGFNCISLGGFPIWIPNKRILQHRHNRKIAAGTHASQPSGPAPQQTFEGMPLTFGSVYTATLVTRAVDKMRDKLDSRFDDVVDSIKCWEGSAGRANLSIEEGLSSIEEGLDKIAKSLDRLNTTVEKSQITQSNKLLLGIALALVLNHVWK